MLNTQVRENYFLPLKLFLVLILECNLILDSGSLSGAAGLVLLFSAFFLTAVTGCELTRGIKQGGFLLLEVVFVILLTVCYRQEFFLLLTICILDFVSVRIKGSIWYCCGFLPVFFTEYGSSGSYLFIVLLLIIIYAQHGIVIRSYQEQLQKVELAEQKMKRNMSYHEAVYQEEISRSLLAAENSILEEKARISQVLHDKLGHSINGSVYQLEACKVLMDRDKKACEAMLQAVIDNLRGSMDEIREILRKERPDKQKLALLQLQSLCEDCKKLGIEASFGTQGDMAELPDKYLEIILDNACEAISNALKYAKCSKIEIQIVVMNQIVRCTISDNGVGCQHVIDGMGLSGMRKRMRSINGILDFKTDMGFTINMLLPLEGK